MPELPEVETVVRFLRPYLVGKTIVQITPSNNFQKVLIEYTPKQFNRRTVNQTIQRVWRRGKYIVLDLDQGHLLIHLRMTGRLITRLTKDDHPNHVTVQINFRDGSELYFKDYRKFGRLYYYPDLMPLNQKLGIEPLSEQFTPEWLFEHLLNRKRTMKPLLLDQSFIVGLGNIYTDEALWTARIHPLTSSQRISRMKSNQLREAIQMILQDSINMQGTTIINFYFGEKSKGNFRSELKVFHRLGEPCFRCGTNIRKMRVAQRGTHICPRCQRRKK